MSVCTAWRRAAAAALLLVGLLVALPSPASASATSGSNTARYVVVLHDDRDSDATAQDHARRYGAKIRYVYRRALHGYAASLTAAGARAVAADSSVERVEADRVVRSRAATVPWGLDRLDQPALPLDHEFHPPGDGSGVTAYVIDTGIRLSHHDLGGRAVSGLDAVDGGSADDCNGHGTHVAGTIGGAAHGVAPAVRLVAVRVLGCQGQGTISQVIAGVDWVTSDHQPGQPAVANLSLGGGISVALDKAVTRSVADGVAYSVAAGNDGADACTSSPGRVPGVMTVGAVNRSDAAATWSDIGTCVDWFAPGVSISSDWDTSDTATRTISGTSMAAPHAAGVAAVYLGLHPAARPSDVEAALLAGAVERVTGAPVGTTTRLLQLVGT